MYLGHFNLKEKPFTLSTDPRFLWVGSNQRQALLTLGYGLQENEGLVVLGGAFGTGKTTLVNAFVQGLDENVIVAQLPEPGTEPSVFLQSVAQGFGIQSKIDHLDHLARELLRLDDDDRPRPKLLIIDEAQQLTPELLEELLHLARLRHAQSRLIHILLVGQNELYQWLTGPTREAFIKEVAATCRVNPMRAHETAAYIDHRLHRAGAGRTPFTQNAIREIHAFSRGVPRTINLTCDYSLLYAHMENLDEIDAGIVAICKDRFQIANLEDSPTTKTAVRDQPPLPSEPPAKRHSAKGPILPLAATFLLLLIVAGGYLYYHPDRLPQWARQAIIREQPTRPVDPPPARTEVKPPPVQASPEPSPQPQPDQRPSAPALKPVNFTAPPTVRPQPTTTTAPPQPPTVKVQSTPDDTPEPPKPVRRETTPVAEPPALPTPPEEATAEPPPRPLPLDSAPADSGSDPGAIIDWLIQKNRKDPASTNTPTSQP